MTSVTCKIKTISQPEGGLVKQNYFTVEQLLDDHTLNVKENVGPELIGLCVDYMTRFIMGTSVEQAFEISLRGSKISKEFEIAEELSQHITGANKESVFAACRLVVFDTCYRMGTSKHRPISEINPDDKTLENIIIMINRSVAFWNAYGPIVLDGFTFEGGYTKEVLSGDGDYLTKDTLWDFKVSKYEPTS